MNDHEATQDWIEKLVEASVGKAVARMGISSAESSGLVTLAFQGPEETDTDDAARVMGFASNSLPVLVAKLEGGENVVIGPIDPGSGSRIIGINLTDRTFIVGLLNVDTISGSAGATVGDLWIESALGLPTINLQTNADSRIVTVAQKVLASSALSGSTILTAETAFDTFASIPADALRLSLKGLRITGYATYHVGAAGSTLRFKVRLNDGTNQYVIFDSGAVTVGIGTDGIIQFDITRFQASTGGSTGWGRALFTVSAAQIADQGDAGNGTGTGPSAGSTAKIEATVQFSVANSGNTASLGRMLVEVF